MTQNAEHSTYTRACRREGGKRTTFNAICRACPWQGRRRTRQHDAAEDGWMHEKDQEAPLVATP